MKIIEIFGNKVKEKEALRKIEERSTKVSSAQTDLTCAVHDLNCEIDRFHKRKRGSNNAASIASKS